MTTPVALRHFLYLDAEKLRSFSAQLLGGVPESGTTETGHDLGGAAKAEAGFLRFVRAEGGADYRYHRTSTETRSLHHQVYSLFEAALIEECLLETVDGSFDFTTDWVADHFGDAAFIRVRGTVRMVDYSRNFASIAAFPKLLKAFKAIQLVNIKNSADAGTVTPEDATAQRRQLNEMESSVKSMPLQEMVVLGETLYSPGVIRIKVRASGAPIECVFAGNGDSEWLTEPLAIGGITQSPPSAEWVAVGQVTAATWSGELDSLATGNGIEDGVEMMGANFRELLRAGSGAVFPALEFTPLAVYREILAS